MKSQQIAVIEWTDAAMHGTEQFSREETKKLNLVEGVAVGIIVHEDRKQITLAMDWFYKDDQFRQVSSYPKSGIRSVIRKELRPVPDTQDKSH